MEPDFVDDIDLARHCDNSDIEHRQTVDATSIGRSGNAKITEFHPGNRAEFSACDITVSVASTDASQVAII